MPKLSWMRAMGVGVFLVAFPIQYWLWSSPLPYTDASLWTKAAVSAHLGVLPGFSSPIPSHPGTTILLPAAGFMLLGFSPYIEAMHITMALLMSICIAIIAYLCYKLRPESLWWLAGSVFLVSNPLYLAMSAPSAFVALLCCIYVLLLFYIREKGASEKNVLLLGACGGVMLATRVDISASFILFSLPYLWPLARGKVLWLVVGSALFFGALNPYLWQDPVLYVRAFMNHVGANVVKDVGFGYSLVALVLPVTSFLFGITAAYLVPTISSLPKDLVKWLLATSALLCCIIMLSQYHPIRYFFPVMAVWEAFLPLFLLELLAYFSSWKALQPLRRSEYALVILLVIPRVFSIYSLWVF